MSQNSKVEKFQAQGLCFRSKANPFSTSFGFFTKPCIIKGIQSTAFFHPYRFIVHNGEINTIRGNADRMLGREENMDSPFLKDEMTPI